MQFVQTKLITETEDVKEKHKPHSTMTFFKRLERIKSADDKWQEEYSSEKEKIDPDEAVSSKKRKRISDVNDIKQPMQKKVMWAEAVTEGNGDGAKYREMLKNKMLTKMT